MKLRTLAFGVATLSTLGLTTPAANAGISSIHSDTATVILAGAKLMTANRIVGMDVNSNHLTSWIPAMDVETTLRDLGMDAHWVGSVHQLVINMPKGYSLPTGMEMPYHVPPKGYFIVIVNAKTVAIPPVLKGGGAYLPLYYVMGILNALGVTSEWNGQKWVIAGKVSVPSDTNMSGDVSKTFTLQLSNSRLDGLGGNLPAPPVAPAAAVAVTLPWNSSLQPTSQKLVGAYEDTAMEDYVQTGRSNYTVNQPIAAVEYWFKAAYTAQGFSRTGSGSFNDIKTGDYVESTVYSPLQQLRVSGQQETVAMSYQALGPTKTEVEYFVSDIVVPARPASSQIPFNAVSVTVTVNTTTSGQTASQPTTTTMTMTNRTDIAKLTAAVNALTNIAPPSMHSSPQYAKTQFAKVVFQFPDGHSLTMTASKFDNTFGDVVIGDLPLFDYHGTVWNAITVAIGQ